MNWLSKSFAAFVTSLSLPVQAGELTVEINGIRSSDGRVMVAVHMEREGVVFPDESGAVAGAWTVSRTGAWQLVFPELPDGRYAVSVMHDENANGGLDTNLLGVPVEGYGFSNDAMGFMGPPEFGDASVVVGNEPGRALVTLRY